ncbi:LCP family protein [Nocardiopsis lambiniae]|uniref:LCP family protein n=1 Tax=Nocardiopsis lambiniae TaxID=3075539 RepID=A0ABU2M7W6_9ACTN|nr:LCP family protein [Nocardiopsis sp. DSM 44743]MDT0328759.1 LCP family protein [Nocardiopsis sp. DSM 44743]
MSPGQWVACGMTGVVIAASLTGYVGYRDALAVQTEQINTDAWGDRPAQVEGIRNILLLATDERAGEDAAFNEVNGIRPDVLILVNIDVDKGGVTMVNLPRDLMVTSPGCDPAEDKPGVAAGTVDQLNHAMFFGGLDCQGKTIEAITHVHLDHMVIVDFAGFQAIVDSIGGVDMCIPEPLQDRNAKLDLPAGQQTLDGTQALALARSRDTTENGSDLDRIKRQQEMIGAILRKVTTGEIMSSPTTLYDFFASVTDSLITDDGFTVDEMGELAIAMRDVDLGRMNMLMVPVDDYVNNRDKVQLREPEASGLFAAIAAGEAASDPEEDEGGEEAGESAEESVSPSEVSVHIVNNEGTPGLAAQVEPLLSGLGFTVTGSGNPTTRAPGQTTVYHAPGEEAKAAALADVLVGGAAIEEAADLSGSVELVMGSDWQGVEQDGADSGDEGSEDDPLAGLGVTSADERVDCG